MTNFSLSRLVTLTLCIGLFATQTTITIDYQIPQKYLNYARHEAAKAQKRLENSQEWKQREENRSKIRLYGYFGIPTLGGVVAAAVSCYSGNYEGAVASVAIGASVGAGLSFANYQSKKKTNEVELDLEAIRVLSVNSLKSKDKELNKARFVVGDTIKKTYCQPRHFVKETEKYKSSKCIRESFFDTDAQYEDILVTKDIWEYGIDPHDKYTTDLVFGIVETASDNRWNLQLCEEVGYNLLYRDASNLNSLAKRSMTTI